MDIPADVLNAARVLTNWARDEGIDLVAYTERAAQERYAIARRLGTTVQVERWRGPGLGTVRFEEYDRVIDNEIRRATPTIGTTIATAEKLIEGK